MATLIGIAGALRQGSFNAALLRAACELAPPGLELEAQSIRGVPLYDGDVEAAGLPAPVTALKERLAAADGLLLVTPEYNHSVPGVLKNAIDWMTRPAADIKRVFGGKVVGVIGASTGARGTILSQTAWLPVFRTLRMRPYFEQALYVAGAAKLFAPDGKLTDEDTRTRLRSYLEGLLAFIDNSGTRY